MRCRYFQYGIKPKKQRMVLESYGSATRWVFWNYCLELNQAVPNIQREAINIISRTGTVRIQARGDTSGGDEAYNTSSHVSMNREKFLSTGKEATIL